METISTLSQELLQTVTAEPEIAEKMQALVEIIEEMIRSNTDEEKLTALEQFAEDGTAETAIRGGVQAAGLILAGGN